jgi:hypothetical protein
VRHNGHLPFFYSDMFQLGYEAVGEVDSRLEMFADWKKPNEEGVVYYLASECCFGTYRNRSKPHAS